MNYKLLHIFRNTPFGRETFFQSLYFGKTVNVQPVVYVPTSDKFLMYFSNDAVQVDLDRSYLTDPDSAKGRVEELFDAFGLAPRFYEPKNFTASSLPDVSTDFDYFCCPRSVSDLSSKIGLGHIGPKVRRIIKQAGFPILITSPVFKPWQSISVFYGGSKNAMNALILGIKIAIASGLPLDVYSMIEKDGEEALRAMVQDSEVGGIAEEKIRKWHFYKIEDFDTMLYDVPHDSLITLGAYGHGLIKEMLLGSKMEHVQSMVNNNLLITGPNCSITLK